MRNILLATVAFLSISSAQAQVRRADTDAQAISRTLGCITDAECEGLDDVPADRSADTVFEPGSKAAKRAAAMAKFDGVTNADLLSQRLQHLKALREIRGEMRGRVDGKTMRDVTRQLQAAK